jgi:hypothetical protein
MSRDEWGAGSIPDLGNRLYIVLVNRAHVLGGRVFDTHSEASAAMTREAEQVAKREASARRRTVTLRVFSDHARVEVGEANEDDRLFHTLCFHGSLKSWSEIADVTLVEPDSSRGRSTRQRSK